jgi:hypothetical protein
VLRLLVLFHDPYHSDADEARAWLCREVKAVLGRDGLQRATLTRLGDGSTQWGGGFDWLLEFEVLAPQDRRGAVGEMVADLRLLGMSPVVATADDRNALELEAR